jgi:hypothetical protein
LQAGGRRFDPVWLHQPGDVLVRFDLIFASLAGFEPRGRELSDIVKRRSIRAPLRGSAGTSSQEFEPEPDPGACGTLEKSRWCLTARRRTDLASWSFKCQCLSGSVVGSPRSGRVLS